jgi:excisionase family DNA binding protein
VNREKGTEGGIMAGREPRNLLTVKQTAERLGIATQTIYNGIARRTLKPFPIKPKRWGRNVLFDSRDIDEYINSMPYAQVDDTSSGASATS